MVFRPNYCNSSKRSVDRFLVDYSSILTVLVIGRNSCRRHRCNDWRRFNWTRRIGVWVWALSRRKSVDVNVFARRRIFLLRAMHNNLKEFTSDKSFRVVSRKKVDVCKPVINCWLSMALVWSMLSKQSNWSALLLLRTSMILQSDRTAETMSTIGHSAGTEECRIPPRSLGVTRPNIVGNSSTETG